MVKFGFGSGSAPPIILLVRIKKYASPFPSLVPLSLFSCGCSWWSRSQDHSPPHRYTPDTKKKKKAFYVHDINININNYSENRVYAYKDVSTVGLKRRELLTKILPSSR